MARTISGVCLGIKTTPRGGGPQGEKREEAFSTICEALGVAEACRAVCVDAVPGLPGFENSPSVVTQWLPQSKQVGEVTAEELRAIEPELENVMAQAGRWVAVNLHLGLEDRQGLKNWVWSHQQRRLAAIDTESAFLGATVQEHRSIIDKFYGAARLKAERGKSLPAVAFERALRETHTKIRTNPQAITSGVANIETARNYVSPCLDKTEDQFVETVFGEIA